MADTPLVLGCDTEIQTDTLGVADVQIAVRLRREPRHHSPAPFICLYVFGHNLSDKVKLGIFFFARRFQRFLPRICL
jgi:hypothetical protein